MLLVVDDEEDVRATVAEILEVEGYETYQAAGGAEALEIVRELEGEVDLAVIDVRMPGMGGPEVAARLRKQWPDTRALLMTGFSEDDLEQGEDALPLLTKPFHLSTLTKRVHELLEPTLQ